MVASRDPSSRPRGRTTSTASASSAPSRGCCKVPDGTLRILVQGAQRVQIDRLVQERPYLVAEISELPDVVEETPELTALMRNVQGTFTNIVEAVPYLPEELQMAVANLDDPSALSHLIAGSLRLKPEEKQELLEEVDVARRLRRLAVTSSRASSRSSRSARGSSPRSSPSSTARSASTSCASSSRRSARSSASSTSPPRRPTSCAASSTRRAPRGGAPAGRPRAQAPRVAAAAGRRARRHPHLPGVDRLAALDDVSTTDNLDLAHAREVLDEDHYDIEQVKERILEFLAVRRSSRTPAGRSCASSARPASARRRSGARSPARWGASSSASARAACATRRRSAATGARTSARCPARSSARCATRARTTRCS